MILTTAPGVVRILLENIVLSRAKATADLEKDRGPHMKLFWAWFNLFCWILIAIALVKFAPICWDIYKGNPRTASAYYKKLMKLCDRNELLILKSDAFMKRWIWWLLIPMVAWLLIGMIIKRIF